MPRFGTNLRSNPVLGFLFSEGLWEVPGNKLDTLKWVLAIKMNVAVGLLFSMAIAILLPGAPAENIAYLILVAALYITLNGSLRLKLKGEPTQKVVERVARIFIPAEVLVGTLAVFFSGGALTPMFIVYTLSIVMSIILLTPNGVYKITAFTILQYCTIVAVEAYGVVPRLELTWGGQPLYAAQNFNNYLSYVLIVCSTFMATGYMGNRIARLIDRRNRQIRNQVGELRAIYNISRELGSIIGEKAIVDYLAETLTSLNKPYTTIIYMINGEDLNEVAATRGLSADEAAKLRAGDYKPLTEVRGMLSRGEPVILDDLADVPKVQQIMVPAREMRSLYIFPMMADRGMLGAISFAFERPYALGKEYCHLLTSITNQAAVAIQRARLFHDSQRLAAEMRTLYDIGLHTGSTLSKDEVIRRTSANMEKLMSPDMYYIALYDAETETVSFEYFIEHGHVMPRMEITLGPEASSLTATIIRTCEPLLVRDWHNDLRGLSSIAQKAGGDMLSYLGVPMMFDNKVIGVLSVQCTKPNMFDENSQRLLEAMSAQAAIALENARLHSLAQEGAMIDSLTKVNNHGRFVELVNDAIDESDRNGSNVALIMLDLDHFKLYNDTYGHVAGDDVLKMVAAAIKRSVRDSDAVGRWGGEEFGVLLPGLDMTEAKKVARRIRREIAALRLIDGEGEPIISPTVSQGLSLYPYPSTNTSDLIEDADAALYFAKQHGRNQLVASSGRSKRDAQEPSRPGEVNFTRSETTTKRLSGKLNMQDATVTTDNLLTRTSG